MSKIKHRIFLAGFISFVFFFSFFQPSQAGFFDWFRKSDSQEAATVVSKAKQYTLSVSKSGSGVVTSDDGKINCGKQCKSSYLANSKIILKAEAGNNYKFERWNGCDKVLDGKCQTTLNKSKMIVAKFVSKKASFYSSQKSSSASKSSAVSSKTSSSKSSSSATKTNSSQSSMVSSQSASSKSSINNKSNLKSSQLISQSSANSVDSSVNYSSISNNDNANKNVFIVADDGNMIMSGCIQSDNGCEDVTDRVNKEKVIKKFIDSNTEAKSYYDFIVIITTFKPGINEGQFTHTKKVTKGALHYSSDVNLPSTLALTGLTGSERLQGYAFVKDIDSALKNNFLIINHEVSHRWLFDLGCYEESSKCSHMWQLAGGHYGLDIDTTTKEGVKIYQDPNNYGLTFLKMSSENPGYCINNNADNSKRKFNSLSLYLMGLVAPEEAKPIKWYQNDGNWSEKGVICTEKELNIQEVLSLIGSREPAYPNTQKDFSVAFLLLKRKDEVLSDSQISKINFIANQFPNSWHEATSYKSTINGVK